MERTKIDQKLLMKFDKEYFEDYAKGEQHTDMATYGLWQHQYYKCLDNVYHFRGKKVVDIGCAYGGFVLSCLLDDVDAYGCDISTYTTAEERLIHPALKGKLFSCPAHDMKCFKDNEFDIVISEQVLEHIPEELSEKSVSEIMRITKPGGHIRCSGIFGVKPPKEYVDDPTHINIQLMQYWKDLFEKYGAIDEYVYYYFRLLDSQYNGQSMQAEYNWPLLLFTKKG